MLLKSNKGIGNMDNKNICKFVVPNITNTLTISKFVLESDKATMTKRTQFQSHHLILVISGQGVFHFGRESIEAESGSVLFGFRGEKFYIEAEEELQYMYISFDGMRSGEIFDRFGIDSDNRYFKGFSGIIPLWRESLSHADEVTIDLAAESILLYTFSKFAAQALRQESIVRKVIEITKERFSDPGLSITVLSEELSYNPKYLSHKFKEQMGMKYTDYLRNMRLKFAVSLFDNGIDSVKNVALLSGFSDPLYFSTIFKKIMGKTPKDYKANLSDND